MRNDGAERPRNYTLEMLEISAQARARWTAKARGDHELPDPLIEVNDCRIGDALVPLSKFPTGPRR